MKRTPSLLPPEQVLFDRVQVAQHRRRAATLDWPRHRFLFNEIAERLAERLLDINHFFSLALDLGGRDGAFGDKLVAMKKIDRVIRTDLTEVMLDNRTDAAVVADEEFLPFKENSFDLIGSVLGLHWTNDLPGALSQIARSLKPNGLFLGALFGIESLQELKACLIEAESEIKGGVSPRVSPFTEIRDAGSLLQRAGLALPVTDTDLITLKYENPFALMHELRGMGENNALIERQKYFTQRQIMLRAAELYIENYADEDGLIPATFQIIYLSGWAPHESQQKPIARGSGKINLRDYLEK
ncbi:methyltransferase domain-containing protein [Sneathiella sp. CAU 1612]|uniref:Methyltransferase domain-containing protein n=1 Tax=Sneathiella sedimenti TaxID=2816034 RepID=A0ABS3F0W8_9PROT|nr:methyltransferase domain-containing protein [Sneathiella sedimenti]MBO0331988.1 methyltransferase domain-containing protein [Sneathiella sedimenti]